jgi:hypothetical protein
MRLDEVGLGFQQAAAAGAGLVETPRREVQETLAQGVLHPRGGRLLRSLCHSVSVAIPVALTRLNPLRVGISARTKHRRYDSQEQAQQSFPG